jgi:hypothetical protein
MNMQNNTQIPQGRGGESVAKASEKSDNKLNSSLSLYAVGSVA